MLTRESVPYLPPRNETKNRKWSRSRVSVLSHSSTRVTVMSTPHEPKWIDQNWSTQLHRELSGSRAQFTSTCFALIGSKHNELGRIVLNTCIPAVADLEGTSRHRPPPSPWATDNCKTCIQNTQNDCQWFSHRALERTKFVFSWGSAGF